jgi:uncharacterized membrane protein
MIIELAKIFANFIISAIFLILVFGVGSLIVVLLWYRVVRLLEEI